MKCPDCGWPGQAASEIKCNVCGAELERPWPTQQPEQSRTVDRAPGWGGEDEPDQPDDAWPLALERRYLRCASGGIVYTPPMIAWSDVNA